MRIIRLFTVVTMVTLLGLYGFLAGTARAASTGTSLFIPLEGEVTLSNGDVVSFSGQVHVLTQVTFSDAFVPTVNMYVNLQGVEGTSATTGRTYLLVGASNVEMVGVSPGPPIIPDQTFNFSLVETNPGPPIFPPSPILPIYLRDFVFAQEAGDEGSLQNVVASFF